MHPSEGIQNCQSWDSYWYCFIQCYFWSPRLKKKASVNMFNVDCTASSKKLAWFCQSRSNDLCWYYWL